MATNATVYRNDINRKVPMNITCEHSRLIFSSKTSGSTMAAHGIRKRGMSGFTATATGSSSTTGQSDRAPDDLSKLKFQSGLTPPSPGFIGQQNLRNPRRLCASRKASGLCGSALISDVTDDLTARTLYILAPPLKTGNNEIVVSSCTIACRNLNLPASGSDPMYNAAQPLTPPTFITHFSGTVNGKRGKFVGLLL